MSEPIIKRAISIVVTDYANSFPRSWEISRAHLSFRVEGLADWALIQGAKLLNDNSDILFDIAHSPEVWKATFCTEDGMRNALKNRGEGFEIKRHAYATEETKKAFIERFKRDGFEAPVCCELFSSAFKALHYKLQKKGIPQSKRGMLMSLPNRVQEPRIRPPERGAKPR